jgi:competence protein ComEC
VTLIIFALAWLSAIAAISLWGAPASAVALWLAALVPIAAALGGRSLAAAVAGAAVVALLGGLRFSAWRDAPPPDLARYVGHAIAVEGRIDSEPDPGETTTRFTVAVDRIRSGDDWSATSGRLLMTEDQYADYLPGTAVRLTGMLELPPTFDDFDYRAFLTRRGIVGTMARPRLEVLGDPPGWALSRNGTEARLRLESALQHALPEPEASLAAGVVFGRSGNLPPDLYEDFRRTGLAHIVAVSGSNVAIVTAMTFVLAAPLLGRRRAIGPATLTVFAYLVVAGLSASVVRAGIMAIVFLTGELLGRQQSSLAALGAAAIAMTALHPQAAVDVGFQLSLAATAGLIVFGPWIRSGLDRFVERAGCRAAVPRVLTQTAALSLSATLATFPIIWVTFGTVSLIGPLANVLVEPIFVVMFWLSALAAVADLAWAPAGWVFGLAAYYPLALVTWLARTLGELPFASATLPSIDGSAALLAYIALAVAGWPAYRHLAPSTPARGSSSRVPRTVALIAGCSLLGAAVFHISLLPIRGPGALEVTALDVGQGDAILVTTPHGHHVLVDGGPSAIGLARELGAVLPHWQRSIDRVLVTHPQEDHIAGIPGLLDRYDVDAEFDTGATNTIRSYPLYLQRAHDRSEIHAGDSFTEDGLLFEVLWPPVGYRTDELNNTSLIIRITYGATRVLLTGDSEAPAQRELMNREDVRADVLKVPHHGSKTSSTEFLRAVDPAVAVISVGAENHFGHPAPETLAALTGATLFRTDRDGRITVSSDGRRVTVRTER